MNPELARRVAQLTLEHCEVCNGYAEMTTPRKPGRLSRSRSLLLPEQQAEWAVS
jgi:hypothetical protein